MGTVWEEYQIVLDRLNMPASVNVLTGSGMSFMIGRVSYTFGLQGSRAPIIDEAFHCLVLHHEAICIHRIILFAESFTDCLEGRVPPRMSSKAEMVTTERRHTS